MPAFPDFSGNAATAEALAELARSGRIPQAILLGGPEGVGKATLARRFASQLLGHANLIDQDDLSLPANRDRIESRERWAAEKRNEEPLFFASYPDFLTFAPDGPLRQISIPQMRFLKEQAQLHPVRGNRRVFLIDGLDRANEQAANSLLKVLEEPPPYLILLATAENVFDLLPTLRSRAITFHLGRLSDEELRQFVEARKLNDAAARIALAEGRPGQALTIDLDQYRQRRDLLMTWLACGAGVVTFAEWAQRSESFANRRTEKLDLYLKIAYGLLEDLLLIATGLTPVRNRDIERQLATVAAAVDFRWIELAVRQVDQLVLMVRRNIQKLIALDGMAMELRNQRQAAHA